MADRRSPLDEFVARHAMAMRLDAFAENLADLGGEEWRRWVPLLPGRCWQRWRLAARDAAVGGLALKLVLEGVPVDELPGRIAALLDRYERRGDWSRGDRERDVPSGEELLWRVLKLSDQGRSRLALRADRIELILCGISDSSGKTLAKSFSGKGAYARSIA